MCYLKKAFLLVQDIMEDTMRFKDNTRNAIVIVKLQELSLRLKSCFTKDYDEQDKVGMFWSWEQGVRAEGGFGGSHACPYTQSVFPCLTPPPTPCHCSLMLSFTDSPRAPLLRTCQAGDTVLGDDDVIDVTVSKNGVAATLTGLLVRGGWQPLNKQ